MAARSESNGRLGESDGRRGVRAEASSPARLEISISVKEMFNTFTDYLQAGEGCLTPSQTICKQDRGPGCYT